MNRFAIVRPKSFDDAATIVREGRYSLPVLKAGGMDVVDHLKEGLMEPDALVDVRPLRSNGGEKIRRDADGVITVEANTTLAELASSPIVREHAPVVAQAAGDAATPQVRNVATAAGNLLQRPRCWYYRNDQFDCLKKGGHTCFAWEGENRYHAIFGGGPCHIVHPSNLAPALIVCDGEVHLTGGDRDRIKVENMFHMPADGVRSEHVLEPHEVVTHITARSKPASAFYAVKEKQSFDWPLVMSAVALEHDGDVIRAARVCSGGVAPVPWPAPEVERALAGVNLDDEASLKQACGLASQGADPMRDNAYKAQLLPVAVRRAVLLAAGRDLPH